MLTHYVKAAFRAAFAKFFKSKRIAEPCAEARLGENILCESGDKKIPTFSSMKKWVKGIRMAILGKQIIPSSIQWDMPRGDGTLSG